MGRCKLTLKEDFSYLGFAISVYRSFPDNEGAVLYLHSSGEEAEKTAELCTGIPCTIVNISGIDWNRDMSPWPAPCAFKGGEDFAGKADEYIPKLENIINETEKQYSLKPYKRMIAGYSLSGLFAVYCLYKTALFSSAASVSGSMWYDGFIDMMKSQKPRRVPERMYFSLGDREEKTRNIRLAAVGSCTEQAAEIMQSLGAETKFELNPGNHFAEPEKRMAKGIEYITGGK